MNLKPKKCTHCKRVASNITTDGTDLYVKGERMPRELIKATFPCVHCKGVVVWVREKVDEKIYQ